VDCDLDTTSTTGSKGHVTGGQIIAYTTTLLSNQYRTHAFSVLIIKDYARLIRWDRGGAIITEPIYYNTESYLFDFLVCYDHASKEARGHDPTVGPPTDDEERAARRLTELVNAKSLLSVTIQDPKSHKSRCFIISGPRAQPDIRVPTGRWTRTSIAYDVQRNRRVLLKDSWRVLMEGIEPEGVTYARLNNHLVPNVPRCELAGDVGDEEYHRSLTHKFVNEYYPHPFALEFVPHRHHRLVLDHIGRKLEDFNNSKEMINASLIGKLIRSC